MTISSDGNHYTTNGYHRRKWTRWSKFKSLTRLYTFCIAQILFGKVWIQLFSRLLWVNSWAGLGFLTFAMTTCVGEGKPVKLRLKSVLVPHPGCAKGLVNIYVCAMKRERERGGWGWLNWSLFCIDCWYYSISNVLGPIIFCVKWSACVIPNIVRPYQRGVF